MVTIKIQSIDDIAAAYLKTLNFSEKKIAEILPRLLKQITTEVISGDDIVNELDKLVLKTAQKVFGKTKYGNEQLTALFKAGYLLNNGAEIWGDKIFSADKISSEFIEKMQNTNLRQAPDYAFSKMEPQKIESAVSANIFHRIAKLFGKD